VPQKSQQRAAPDDQQREVGTYDRMKHKIVREERPRRRPELVADDVEMRLAALEK
jgi:hypothetical protein